jgi:urease accessory protein
MPEDGRFSTHLPEPRLQRAGGRAAVVLEQRRGATRLDRLYQSGSAKAFLPDMHGAPPEVVFLNTAGGLTGGDDLGFDLRLGPAARAVATTQTAERAYASPGGMARMRVGLTLAPGAALDWLPQETILFDRSALDRRTVAELSGDARLLMVEMLVLGRAAMGETPADLILRDWREVRRDGRPVLVEPVRLVAETLRTGPAGLGGARALATVALIAPGAEDRLAALRAALPPASQVAASGWGGRLVARLAAADLAPLKAAVARILDALRGTALPRVWQM